MITGRFPTTEGGRVTVSREGGLLEIWYRGALGDSECELHAKTLPLYVVEDLGPQFAAFVLHLAKEHKCSVTVLVDGDTELMGMYGRRNDARGWR